MIRKLTIACFSMILAMATQATEESQLERLYLEPIKIKFCIKGDINIMDGSAIRITCSDARSVLTSHNWKHGFCKETSALVPEANIRSLYKQMPVDFANHFDIYDVFKAPEESENINNKLVKTFYFDHCQNFNGVVTTFTQDEQTNGWAYDYNEWTCNYDFYPWGLAVLSTDNVTKNAALLFQIMGYWAGVEVPKVSQVLTYLDLIHLTQNKEALQNNGDFATVCYEGIKVNKVSGKTATQSKL